MFACGYLINASNLFVASCVEKSLRKKVLGQKTPRQKPLGHKPPDKKPLDKNPPGQKPPLPKTPQTKHSFQKFYNFCFQNELWKRNLNLVFSSKIHKAWVHKVMHGWHNLMLGWWFLKEPFWVA